MERDFKRISQIINSCITIDQLERCEVLIASFEFKHGENRYATDLAVQYFLKEKQLKIKKAHTEMQASYKEQE